MKAGVARVYDADASRPTYRFVRGNENNPDTSVTLQPGIPQLFGKPDLKIEPVSLPVEAYFPGWARLRARRSARAGKGADREGGSRC